MMLIVVPLGGRGHIFMGHCQVVLATCCNTFSRLYLRLQPWFDSGDGMLIKGVDMFSMAIIFLELLSSM